MAQGGRPDTVHIGNTLTTSNTDPKRPTPVRQTSNVAPGHCPKCDELFKTPRMLPCGHNFCDHCIRADIAGYTQPAKQQGVFRCPVRKCGEQYELPQEGVDGLPLNRDIPDYPVPGGPDVCKKHNLQVSFICDQCQVTICATCYNESHRDRGHRVTRLKDHVIRKQKEIREALRDVQPKVENIGQYQRKLEKTRDMISKIAAEEVREVDDELQRVVEHLQTQAETLKKQIAETASSEKKKVTRSIEGLKKILHDFGEIKSKAKQLSQHGDDEDVEREADDLLAQLTRDWCPSVPLHHVLTTWTSTRAELSKMVYGGPELGVTVQEEQKIGFQYAILSYSAASVTATETNTFTSGFDDWNRTQFCVSDDGHIFMSGKVGNLWNIVQLSMEGKKVWETEKVDINNKSISKPCGLQVITLADKQYLVSSSASQHSILLYDINAPGSSGQVVYNDPHLHFNQMCLLPPNTLLVVCAQPRGGRKILYMRQVDSSTVNMNVTHMMDTEMENAYGIHVVSTDLTPEGNLIILTCWAKEGCIKAFKLDGSPAWEVKGLVGGVACNPHGVCADRRGHVYIADGKNKRVLVLNAATGTLIQTLLTNDQHGIGLVYSVGWSELRDRRFLIVNHKSDKHQQLTTFKIGYQVQVAEQD